MAIDQGILELLEDRELSVKDLALVVERSPAALYKPLTRLVQAGLVRKRDKLIKGKRISFYSVLSERRIEGCSWLDHKEILLAGKTYRENVLEADFWPSLKKEIVHLKERKETFDILITGLKGAGKSVTGIWLSHGLDPDFSVKRNIILRKEQLLRLAVDQPSNAAFVLDDLGTSLSSRGWAGKEREAIFSFFEICRQNQIHLIGTSPSLDLVDLNFRRLIRYVWDVQLRCTGHVHIIVHKSVSPGLKPAFKPVGVLRVSYPNQISHLVDQYELLKKEKLRGAAKDALETLERLKQGAEAYVLKNPIARMSDDVVRSALHSIGVNGDLSKQAKDEVRVVMFDTLQDKRRKKKASKAVEVKQDKANLTKARLSASYRAKYQAYIDKGRSEEFAKILAYRLIYEKQKAGNLKNLAGAMGSLLRKVNSASVERFVLEYLDDIYLVRGLRYFRDLLTPFKLFDEGFHTKVFGMLLLDPPKAVAFIEKAREMRGFYQYRYRGKFSSKRWREGVEGYLRSLEAQEQKGDLADSIVKFGLAVYGLAAKKPGVVSQYEQYERSQKHFWKDI